MNKKNIIKITNIIHVYIGFILKKIDLATFRLNGSQMLSDDQDNNMFLLTNLIILSVNETKR